MLILIIIKKIYSHVRRFCNTPQKIEIFSNISKFWNCIPHAILWLNIVSDRFFFPSVLKIKKSIGGHWDPLLEKWKEEKSVKGMRKILFFCSNNAYTNICYCLKVFCKLRKFNIGHAVTRKVTQNPENHSGSSYILEESVWNIKAQYAVPYIDCTRKFNNFEIYQGIDPV